jgi:hypothetical protein
MPLSVKEMLAEANAAVPRIQAAELSKILQADDVLVVDVRDTTEVQASGKEPVNVSRGMLEFRADPESQYHNPAFQKDKRVVLYCGSAAAWRWPEKHCRRWATTRCSTPADSRSWLMREWRSRQCSLVSEQPHLRFQLGCA